MQPLKSTGYAIGVDDGSKGIRLGVDDIEKFRKDREKMIGVSESPPVSGDRVVEDLKDEKPQEMKSSDGEEMPEKPEEKALLENKESLLSGR
jgi:hypothetical protein